MLNHSAHGSNAIPEKVKICFDSILKWTYEKTSANNTMEATHSLHELPELLNTHPNHPAIAACCREYIPYIVCALDFLSRQAERATTAQPATSNKTEQLLKLYDFLCTGWIQAHIPADSKVPEAFLKRERPRMLAAFENIDNSWKRHAFQLPATIALEAVLVLANTPAHQPVTYSQWAYGQRLMEHMQQHVNQPNPLTEEQVITTLLALRCNTGQFTIWFTEHTKSTLQLAGSVTEKKST